MVCAMLCYVSEVNISTTANMGDLKCGNPLLEDSKRYEVNENGQRVVDDSPARRKWSREILFGNNPRVNTFVKKWDLRNVCPLIIFGLMLVLLIILTAICIGSEPESYSTYGRYGTNLCVPCRQLQYHAEDSFSGIEKPEDRITCCAQDENQFGNLVKRYTNHWYKMKLEKDNPTFKYCPAGEPKVSSIKLKGANVDNMETRSRMVVWDQTLLDSNGLAYRDGYISVPETALYFVYSQLVFLDTENSRAENETLTPYNMLIFTHSVSQSTSGMEKTVLRGSNTPEPCDVGNNDKKTSYLGSYMILHAGDKLAVKLAGARDLVRESEMNFFGVHKA